MVKKTPTEKRRLTMLAKFDNDETKLKAHYRELQKKSRVNYNGSGGLGSLSEERRKEIQAMGTAAAKRKAELKRSRKDL